MVVQLSLNCANVSIIRMRLVWFFLVMSLDWCQAHSNGAPTGACQKMIPLGHPESTADREKRPPFVLEAHQIPQSHGQVLVNLTANQPNVPIKGFLIMARDENSPREDDRGQGYFYPGDDPSRIWAKPMDCPNMPSTCSDAAACQGTANAITHQDGKEAKFGAILSIWTPPASMSGKSVTFVATVVQEFDLWWRGIESNTVDLI